MREIIGVLVATGLWWLMGSYYYRYKELSCIKIQVNVVGVRFELSRWINKKVLAAHSFHTGVVLRFLVNLGAPKHPYTFYRWIHSGVPAFANYQVV